MSEQQQGLRVAGAGDPGDQVHVVRLGRLDDLRIHARPVPDRFEHFGVRPGLAALPGVLGVEREHALQQVQRISVLGRNGHGGVGAGAGGQPRECSGADGRRPEGGGAHP
ncbi:hypothetical protein ACFFX0_13910 [Citricoccus parietis]|uniref:Uncharacterized protein n=1 Tax=Citricoccus parietis TaxID=592307 RepID=A0ABV5FZY7_9MICC